MRIAAKCPTCATYTDANCVMYTGCPLLILGTEPPITLSEALKRIDISFNNLDAATEKIANKTTDIYLNRFSGTKYPTTSAVFNWVSSNFQSILTYTPENVANKSTDINLGTSDTLYPTQNAVKTYVDAAIATVSIPNLQQVLDEGGITSSCIQLEDVPGQKLTSYCPNRINFADLITGAYTTLNYDGLEIYDGGFGIKLLRATGLTSNTTNNLPDANGTLAVSVNGVLADSAGNVILPTPTLQEVTDAGYTTTNPIFIVGTPAGPGSQSVVLTPGSPTGASVKVGGSLNSTEITPSVITWGLPFASTVTLVPSVINFGDVFTVTLPAVTGTLVASVNNTVPNASGNVSVNLQSVLDTGNTSFGVDAKVLNSWFYSNFGLQIPNGPFTGSWYVTTTSASGTGTPSFLQLTNSGYPGNPTFEVGVGVQKIYTTSYNLITGQGSVTIDANNLSLNRLIYVPDANGTFALSVNGVAADTTGNVNLYGEFVAVLSMVDGSTVNLLKNTLGVTLGFVSFTPGTLSCTTIDLGNNFYISATSKSNVPKIVSATGGSTGIITTFNIFQTDAAGVANATGEVYVEIRVYP